MSEWCEAIFMGHVTDMEKAEQTAWLEKQEYVRLGRAAELIGCSVDELLHLGAVGEATILAPVVAEAEYEWPVSGDGHESWQEPFRAKFDASDRVILHRRDVAKIEAVGWVIPRLFFAPEVARQIARRCHSEANDPAADSSGLSKDVTQAKDARVRRQSQANEVSIARLAKFTVPSGEVASPNGNDAGGESNAFALMMAHADTVPWFPVDTRSPMDVLKANTVPQIADKGENRTTADHLFLFMTEIRRLQENTPQDVAAEQRKKAIAEPGKPHGNSSRFSNNREEVLMAAIACLFNQRGVKISGTAWAKIVDGKGQLFWKKRSPPMEHQEITKLLNKAKKYPDSPQWEGRDV